MNRCFSSTRMRQLFSILILGLLSACGASPSTSSPQAAPATSATPAPAGTNNASALPAGFSLAVGFTGEGEVNVGLHPSLALNATDDPLVAYIVKDPNRDGNRDDSTVAFVAWERANARWSAPVVVDTVSDMFDVGPQLELARDASNNMLGIAYRKSDNENWLALSTDGGATWKKEKLSAGDAEVSNPALALANGSEYIAFASDGLHYLSRSGAAGEFKATTAPALPNTSTPKNMKPELEVDSKGRPALAYFLNPVDGYNTAVAFWRPDEAAAVKVIDSNNRQNDNAYISLAFAGDKPRIAVNLIRDEADSGSTHFIASDDGKTWNDPVHIAEDGGNGMNSFLSLAADPQRGAAITEPVTGGNNDGTRCGRPKLAQSSDLKGWTTCSPDADGSKKLDAKYSSLIFDSKGKLYLAFPNSATDAPVQPGLIIWREP